MASIIDLSTRIATNTTLLNTYLTEHNLPFPSFDISAPIDLLPPSTTPPEILSARQQIINDTSALHNLLLGPREHIMSTYQPISMISPKAITQFRLVHSFPVGSETSFSALAAHAGISQKHLTKLIRHGIVAHNLFAEPKPGVIVHSAATKLLAENEGIHNWVEYATHEHWIASYHAVEAMRQYPGSGEPNNSGFSLANQTDKSMFGFYSTPGNEKRLERFAKVMRFITRRPELGPELAVDAFDWKGLPEGGKVVDVGGSHGLVSIELSKNFSQLEFVVQDLDESVVRGAESKMPEEVKDRVKFMVHDFFTEQPVKGADVYFLRAVLHNWSDEYAVRILRNLIPGLKRGSKIVVNDVVLADVGTYKDKSAELWARVSDLTQVVLQNSGDREIGDYIKLFEAADERLKYKEAKPMPGSTRLWIIVAEWEGTDS
ncbi:S-adenosyl-L-methionine-dependent methyltransferase [Podospora fimiseda]|uniref:S-adenosyl-L-methionine-dependent methyltransferase n=1 Tax=Podospora fimiseda TaxID=252190 RepID=A0AAN7BHI5_9PEZI|nr:S-adenosyl-L-methionine-dependent methyltransferase [Podospora fimiseda]